MNPGGKKDLTVLK